ncbi:hypothetical protein HPP92_022371 [Vanilla planifolia]|uniref:Uncharacterized protein n=1 Tax=Vanilla planifolia TaxID=51239 RepID=A0A835PT82_VANPL|nr:hypothetical protein HPP92_022371 [Vanilla planifolia]
MEHPDQSWFITHVSNIHRQIGNFIELEKWLAWKNGKDQVRAWFGSYDQIKSRVE